MEKSGEITNLRLQVHYPMEHNGIKLCDYVADFVYEEDGMTITEDSKGGVLTSIYRLKKKMMKAFHGIDIRETGYADAKL